MGSRREVVSEWEADAEMETEVEAEDGEDESESDSGRLAACEACFITRSRKCRVLVSTE